MRQAKKNFYGDLIIGRDLMPIGMEKLAEGSEAGPGQLMNGAKDVTRNK